MKTRMDVTVLCVWEIPMLAWILFCGLLISPKVALAADAIRNASQGTTYQHLTDAIKAARDGDTIEISGGPHLGHFVVPRRLTLRGTGGTPVLDGDGQGSVLEIRADGVVIENLECRKSGKSDNAFEVWGDAGIAVHGNRATLSKVRVTGNDWGVLFFGGEGSVLLDSEVSDNENDGVRILGGQNHRIVGCKVHRNGTGISIDAQYPDREAPLARLKDPAVAKDFVAKKAKSLISHDNVVKKNEVVGNAFYGIVVTWESYQNEINGNRVIRTGKDRKITRSKISAWERALRELSGVTVSFAHEPYGSGILLACNATQNTVAENEVEDNSAHGIVLDLVTKNDIRANRIRANRIGLLLVSANENHLARNRITGHSEFGVRIGSDKFFARASNGNLIAINFLAQNPVNAQDAAGRILKASDIEARLDELPLPAELKQQMARNQTVRDQMIKGYLVNLKPGTNQWDDGKRGNYYDDFDSPQEGFLDRDGDGISEAEKAIPGGNSVDRYPLSAVLVESLLGKTVP